MCSKVLQKEVTKKTLTVHDITGTSSNSSSQGKICSSRGFLVDALLGFLRDFPVMQASTYESITLDKYQQRWCNFELGAA